MSDTVTLREYVDERFSAQDRAVNAAQAAAEKAVSAALAAQEKAILKAEAAAEERFKLLNELRTGVATRDYVESIEKVVLAVSDRVTKMESQKQGSGDTWKVIATIIGVGIAIAGFIGLKG